jgi:hypothetical protein
MFREKVLVSDDGYWRYDMPNLKTGERMFYYSDGGESSSNMSKMIHFIGDLSSLVNGIAMFFGSGLKSIRTKLTKLE